MKITKIVVAVSAAAVITLGGASTAMAGTHHHHKPQTCQTLDISIPVRGAMPGDYSIGLCGPNMPKISVICPQPAGHYGYPAPGAKLVNCAVKRA